MATTKVNLEKFMLELHQASGMTFDTFHAVFHYVKDRNFGRTSYQQIKNGEISVEQVAWQMKAVM